MGARPSGFWIKLTAILWLVFGAAPLFAQSRSRARSRGPFPAVQLLRQMRGEEAIRALGRRLPEVAEWYGRTPAELARLFRKDRDLWVDRNGRLMYACELEPPLQAEDAPQAAEPVRDPIAGLPLNQTFQLHSLPGSKRVIYLNFEGGVVSGTAWNDNFNNGNDIVAAPFDLDNNPGVFNNTELQRIQNIWRRVAEDYSPFDVDVTTEEPDPSALTRSSQSDEYYGNTVVITSTDYFYHGAGGVSYVGTFMDSEGPPYYFGDYYKPSWVFFDDYSDGEKRIAEAAAHENGHALGLSHQGKIGGTEYYQGQGDWAPIMGTGYYRNVTQWAKGEYAGANNTEDALQIIQSFGLDYYPDDHGDTAETATALDSTPGISGNGFIEQNTDIDVFQLLAGAGPMTLEVAPVPLGPDLNIMAELRDANWNLVASSSPPDDLDADISTTVPLGVYYLAISGTGSGNPLTDGYSDYASLGQYAVSGSVVDPGNLLMPPDAVISASSTSGDAPLEIAFSGLDSTDDGTIVAYVWDFDDGSPVSSDPTPVHTYYSAGSYEVTLTVTDNHGLKGNASATITVTKNIHVDSIILTPESTSTWVSANATLTIVDRVGNPINGATVTGVWSGIVQGADSDRTGAAGTAYFSSPQSSISGTIVFRVTGVSASGCDYDPQSNVQTEASIVVDLVDLPLVAITSPSAFATVSGVVSVQVSASSSLGISFVELSADGESLGIDSSLPYSFSWDTEALIAGLHTLTARAVDVASGTQSASIQVTVEAAEPVDDIPPNVNIVSPEMGAVVSGIITVSVNANDNVGVTRVELYVDGKRTAVTTSAPYEMEWSVDETPGGQHAVEAKAFDAAGNSTVSSTVSVAKRAFLQRFRGQRR